MAAPITPTAADVKTHIQEIVTKWETSFVKDGTGADTTTPLYKTLSTEQLHQYVAFKGFLTTP